MSLPVAVAFGGTVIAAVFIIWFILSTALPVAVRNGWILAASLVTLAAAVCAVGIVVLVVAMVQGV